MDNHRNRPLTNRPTVTKQLTRHGAPVKTYIDCGGSGSGGAGGIFMVKPVPSSSAIEERSLPLGNYSFVFLLFSNTKNPHQEAELWETNHSGEAGNKRDQ